MIGWITRCETTTAAAIIAEYQNLSRQQSVPTAADAHTVAAVLIPFTFVPSLRITPAPRKPIPAKPPARLFS